MTDPSQNEGGDLGGTGSAAPDEQSGSEGPGNEPADKPEPEIKPPLPNEIPAPESPVPDIEPYQAPPPADPGLPQPEA